MMHHHTPIGPLVVDIANTQLTVDDIATISQPLVSGVILFTRNFESKDQIEQLIDNIRKIKDEPLLIMADYEGGRVQRFIKGFTRIPPMAELGEHYLNDPELAKAQAFDYGMTTARELFEIGVDLSFSPVLDINHGLCDVIGNRSFSSNKHIVTELAKSYIQGLQKIGMQAVGKHFPGHGGVANDTHKTSAHDSREFSTLWEEDIYPYRRLIPDYLNAVMPSHVTYKDDSSPACFSPFWLKEVLRQKLKFNGVVFSDDLSMEAAANLGDISDCVKRALDASCDWVLLCNNRLNVKRVIEKFDAYFKEYSHDPSLERRQKFMNMCLNARERYIKDKQIESCESEER